MPFIQDDRLIQRIFFYIIGHTGLFIPGDKVMIDSYPVFWFLVSIITFGFRIDYLILNHKLTVLFIPLISAKLPILAAVL